MAMSQSPLWIARHDRWIAVSEDEHMVSSARLGPLRFNTYDTRLAIEENGGHGRPYWCCASLTSISA